MTHLSATARIQFHAGFTLDDAAAAVPYLARLGISHLYASPLSTARAGSTHGYDVTDANRINPELGGEAALERLVACLRQHGMGLILDIVPNHMASASPQNAWFTDVLRFGRSSRYADYFDIDWDHSTSGMADKMLLPILAEPYGQALESGRIKLDAAEGEVRLSYFDRRIPLAPNSVPLLRAQAGLADAGNQDAPLSAEERARILSHFDTDNPSGREAMHLLLEAQHYRLAFWQNAADEINWRRFFEISDLIGMKVENPKVFEDSHALTFSLYRDGLIDGVRVDHIDGLALPREYCRRLRTRLEALHAERPQALQDAGPYIWLEKILAHDERLDAHWQSDGTTGYEFINDALRVLVDGRGDEPLTQFWRASSRDDADFDVYETRAREQILSEHLAGEFERLCTRLNDLSNLRLETRDFTSVVIRRVMYAVLVGFRVYRIYAAPGQIREDDLATLEQVAKRARESLRPADHPALEAVVNWLKGNYQDSAEVALLQVVLARFEQLSAPLAAKAVEDTAFYRYGRLLALNEVGGNPGIFCLDAPAFHERMQARQRTTPLGLSPLATHDHKRGADTRARLAVFSERPASFATLVRDVASALEAKRGFAIHPVDLLMLLQTIVGAWPLDLDVEDEDAIARYVERLGACLQKSLREGKERSNWLIPDEAYEGTARATLEELFLDRQLRRILYNAVQAIAAPGAVNGLAQVALQCLAPGVPDIYQGSEVWDFSLVDPDNRRPVDFALHARHLHDHGTRAELQLHWRDGRIKQWLVATLLKLRGALEPPLTDWDYLPIRLNATAGLLAFARVHGERAIVVVMPRHCAAAVNGTTLKIEGGPLEDAKLPPLPFGALTNILDGARYPADASIQALALLGEFPGAVLVTDGLSDS